MRFLSAVLFSAVLLPANETGCGFIFPSSFVPSVLHCLQKRDTIGLTASLATWQLAVLPDRSSLAPTVASRILFICVLDCAVLFVWVLQGGPFYRGPILCVCLLSASCPKNGVFGDAFDRSLRSPGFLPFLGQMF